MLGLTLDKSPFQNIYGEHLWELDKELEKVLESG
jgi:hypothetical protein